MNAETQQNTIRIVITRRCFLSLKVEKQRRIRKRFEAIPGVSRFAADVESTKRAAYGGNCVAAGLGDSPYSRFAQRCVARVHKVHGDARIQCVTHYRCAEANDIAYWRGDRATEATGTVFVDRERTNCRV